MTEVYFIGMLFLMYVISGVLYGLNKAYRLLRNFRIAQVKFLKNYTTDYITQIELKRLASFETLYIFAFTISVVGLTIVCNWKWEEYAIWKYLIIMFALWKITADIIFRVRYGLKWYQPDRGSMIGLFFSHWITKVVSIAVGIVFAIL